MSEFSDKIYKIVKQIPKGSVLTYKELAKKAGKPKAFRAVGNILNKNFNPDIPCHRVIRSDGKTGGYNRGTKKKVEILNQEKNTAKKAVAELYKISNKEKAESLSRYFKTGKGEYGEGDIFIGITVPEQRKIANHFKNLDLSEINNLLESPIHEHRLTAIFILLNKPLTKEIYDFYIKNISFINNWDLVDSSAPEIVGKYLFDKDRGFLNILSLSKNLWQRRISIVATYYFIQKNEFDKTLEIANILLNDSHDLIHKAVGWMLREVGKRDKKVLVDFINKNSKKMPRTMLRYAIEHFSVSERKVAMLR